MLNDFEFFADVRPISGQGVYAYALKNRGALAGISVGTTGIIYVGMTEQGLDVRNHFLHQHSGFSTFRRSLGALLKAPLKLVAYKRSAGASPTNHRNYRFSDEGEHRLSEWMKGHLKIARQEISDGVAAEEKALIVEMEPPLNLTGWGNPQRQYIKGLRAACAAEAAKNGAIR